MEWRLALNYQDMAPKVMAPRVIPNQFGLVPIADGQGIHLMNKSFQHGQHALKDYHMQLIFLDHQNKRRLMMARQQQDNMHDAQPPVPPQLIPAIQANRSGATDQDTSNRPLDMSSPFFITSSSPRARLAPNGIRPPSSNRGT